MMERESLQQTVLGKLDSCMWKNEIRSFSTLHIKLNSKWIKGLKVRLDTAKLLEENIGRTLSDINHSNIFFDLSPRIMEIKAKINQWDLLKFKSFCTARKIINKMKRQPTDQEKTFANDVMDKGLVSKIYKQLMMLNKAEINNRISKWAEDLNRHFPKKTYRWPRSTWKDVQHC